MVFVAVNQTSLIGISHATFTCNNHFNYSTTWIALDVSRSFNCLVVIWYWSVSFYRIPLSCVEPWLALVGVWRSTEHNTERVVVQCYACWVTTLRPAWTVSVQKAQEQNTFGSSTRTSSPRRCCLEWNDCKRCLMLRYRIDNVCSVAHGTSAFKVRKVSELKAIYPLQCHFQSGWHSLQTGGSISDGGKVEEKGSNASVQSFIHFFLLFSCLPLPNEHVGDVVVLKAMAPSFS